MAELAYRLVVEQVPIERFTRGSATAEPTSGRVTVLLKYSGSIFILWIGHSVRAGP